MNFSFVSTMEGSPWGGSEELWSQTALYLRSRGHNVVASVKEWGIAEAANLRQLEQAGVRVLRRQAVPAPTFGEIVASRIQRRLGTERRVPTLWQEIATTRPDFVLLSSGGAFPTDEIATEFAKKKIPFAVVIHCAAESWWPDDAQRLSAVTAIRAARALFVVSVGNKRLLARQLGFEHSTTLVVRNPFRSPYSEALPWPDATVPLRLAFVGRIDPASKGCDLLIEVLAQQTWRARSVEVSFFGEGSAAEGMRELARYHRLPNVNFRGQVSDVKTIWHDHHMLVLPSRYEGLPIVIVEAMLCGRPCIVTNIAGNAELLDDNITGFIASAPTVESLAEAMERAWEARSNWATMGTRAAIAARLHVPPDPAQKFGDQLIRLAKEASPV